MDHAGILELAGFLLVSVLCPGLLDDISLQNVLNNPNEVVEHIRMPSKSIVSQNRNERRLNDFPTLAT
jgi:hypothetical protein